MQVTEGREALAKADLVPEGNYTLEIVGVDDVIMKKQNNKPGSVTKVRITEAEDVENNIPEIIGRAFDFWLIGKNTRGLRMLLQHLDLDETPGGDTLNFKGIKFQADDDAVSELVRVGEGAAVDGVTFLNCWFDGNTKATVNGVSADHATQAMTGAWFKACRFVLCNVGIDVGVSGMPNSTVEDSMFDMQDAGGGDVGIALADTTALATGYGFLIRNNDFLGAIDAGRDSLGITIAGTQDTVGMGIMRGNFFSNCTVTPITQNKLNEAIINNYVGDTGTGGTLVDPGT